MSNPTSIISKYIEEVRRMDLDARKCTCRAFKRVCEPEVKRDRHFSAAAPKLAEALEVAIKSLEEDADEDHLHDCEHSKRSLKTLAQISHLLSDETKGEGK